MNTQLQNNRPANPVASFNAFMQKHKSQLELALPKHLNADRMVRLSLTAFSQNPALQRCDSKSIFGSIIVASQLGLEIGVNGQGYLVPYKDKCTFVPGWKGLVDLANRGGRCTVWTGAVYEGDEFDYMLGDSPYCKHKPCGEFDESKLTHVYAIGRVKDSEMPVIEVWPIKKVRAHFEKTVVKALQPNHYSKKHFEAYAKKVALLQVLKYMPQSIEMSNAVDVSYAAETGKGVTIEGDFVTIDNSQPEHDADQDSQNSTQYDVHHQEIAAQEIQTFDQEEAVYAPSFEQIKKGILTAKSVIHLEVIEEQALDHADSNERKHLMTLIKAQYQKFQAAEVTAAKKSEAQPVDAPPPKRTRQPKVVEDVSEENVQNETSNNVVEKTSEAEPVKSSLNSDAKRKFWIKQMNQAQTVAELNDCYDAYMTDEMLTDTHRNYLFQMFTQMKEKMEQAAEQTSETQEAPAVDAIKSQAVKNGLQRMVTDAQTIEDLEKKVAPAIRENKPKMTTDHMAEVLNDYAARKKFLEDQQDMFAGVDESITYVDAVIKRIEAARSQDDINAEFMDPAFEDLSDQDKQRITMAAQKREAELMG